MNRGIVTIATKHALYGKFAYNLAVSVKAIAPHIPVSIIADQVGLSHLTVQQIDIFDKIIEPEAKDYYHNDKVTPLTLKFCLYKYSPYEATIFVDADMLFSPMLNMDWLFGKLSGIPFTIANRGEQDPSKGVSEWVEAGAVDTPYWYDLSSEFIYFEKGDTAMAVFESAMKHYREGRLRTKLFAGDKPDEPFFMLGMVENGIKPHVSPFKPSYWYASEKGFKNAMDIKKQYALFSLGGKFIPPLQKKIYSEICRNITYITGLQTMSVQHKMSVIKERQQI